MLMPMPNDDQVTASKRSSRRPSAAPADQAGPATALGGRDYGATLWEPTERSVREARITGYAAWLRESRGLDLPSYDELWRWSVAEPEAFWTSVWDYFGVIGRLGDGPVLSGGAMPDVTWFAGTTLNSPRRAPSPPRARSRTGPPWSSGPSRGGAERSATPNWRPRWPGSAPGCARW